MSNVKQLAVVWIALSVVNVMTVTGCATSPVVKGAILGGASGVALGAGTGALISSEDLLGSSSAPATGNLAIESANTIGAGALIGAVFGTLVGAMVGHAHDDGEEAAAALAADQAARAGELRPIAF